MHLGTVRSKNIKHCARKRLTIHKKRQQQVGACDRRLTEIKQNTQQQPHAAEAALLTAFHRARKNAVLVASNDFGDATCKSTSPRRAEDLLPENAERNPCFTDAFDGNRQRLRSCQEDLSVNKQVVVTEPDTFAN
jgi:hypothetical protein